MRIAIVEDHLMFREVLRKVCVVELQHEVVGEAEDGVRAIELVRRTSPDVLLLDLHLPKLDGFDVIDEVLGSRPDTKILVLSSHCDEFTVYRLQRAGVPGFLDKNTNSVEALKHAIGEVAAGGTSYSDAFREMAARRIRDPRSFDKVLTDRERAVLSLIGLPLNDEEIARSLGISTETAAKHRANLLRKLEIRSTIELVRYARDRGFTLSAPRNGDGVLLP